MPIFSRKNTPVSMEELLALMDRRQQANTADEALIIAKQSLAELAVHVKACGDKHTENLKKFDALFAQQNKMLWGVIAILLGVGGIIIEAIVRSLHI